MTDISTNDQGTAATGTHTVTAFFDSQAAADKARADLVAAGISPDTISLAGGATPAADAPADEGFWHALREFFMPDEDRYTYAEGLRRGGFALSVRTGEAHYDRALDILDADGAVDIDEREQSWRSEGWSGYAPRAEAGADDMAYVPATSGTAGFGASFAGDDGYAPRGSLTQDGSADSESRADSGRVGTGADEPGLLNPDMRERIGSGTASMTPPTPTGPQDSTLNDNAANRDRRTPAYAAATAAEDAALGSPTRSGSEMPEATSTIGSMNTAESSWETASRSTPPAKRDDAVQRARVRGYIIDPADKAQSGL